jgi:hypothetical protein
VPRTVLIVSSGRTGTQFLARYFDANYPRVVGRHEPKPRYRVRIAANAHAAGALSRERTRTLLSRRSPRHVDCEGADLYVESNPFLWGAIDVFDDVFDRPTIVHVVRDPRDQVRSSLNHGTASGLKAVANRCIPYWYPKLAGAPRPSDWVGRAAELWVVVNARLSEYGPRCADYFFVRYEELFDESNSGLRALCERLRLPFAGAGSPVDPAERINRARGHALPGWSEWSDDDCITLQRIAGDLMQRYGYGGEPAWKRRVGSGS